MSSQRSPRYCPLCVALRKEIEPQIVRPHNPHPTGHSLGSASGTFALPVILSPPRMCMAPTFSSLPERCLLDDTCPSSPPLLHLLRGRTRLALCSLLFPSIRTSQLPCYLQGQVLSVPSHLLWRGKAFCNRSVSGCCRAPRGAERASLAESSVCSLSLCTPPLPTGWQGLGGGSQAHQPSRQLEVSLAVP